MSAVLVVFVMLSLVVVYVKWTNANVPNVSSTVNCWDFFIIWI